MIEHKTYGRLFAAALAVAPVADAGAHAPQHIDTTKPAISETENSENLKHRKIQDALSTLEYDGKTEKFKNIITDSSFSEQEKHAMVHSFLRSVKKGIGRSSEKKITQELSLFLIENDNTLDYIGNIRMAYALLKMLDINDALKLITEHNAILSNHLFLSYIAKKRPDEFLVVISKSTLDKHSVSVFFVYQIIRYASYFTKYWFINTLNSNDSTGLKRYFSEKIERGLSTEIVFIESSYLLQNVKSNSHNSDLNVLESMFASISDDAIKEVLQHRGIKSMTDEKWYVLKRQVKTQHRLLKMPGVNLKIKLLRDFSEAHSDINPVAFAQIKVLIARYLIDTGIKNPSATDIERAIDTLNRKFDIAKKIDLSGNIAIITNGEIKDGTRVFGREHFIDALGKRALASHSDFKTFLPKGAQEIEETHQEVVERKRLFLETLSHGLYAKDKNSIFILRGHGNQVSFFLTNGEIMKTGEFNIRKDTVSISAEKFADAIKQRYAQFGADAIENTIIIFNACLQQDMVKKILSILKKSETPPPLFITPSEYGQSSFHVKTSVNRFGSFFNELLIRKDIKTLADFMNVSLSLGTFLSSNLSVSMPNTDKRSALGAVQVADVVPKSINTSA